MINWCRFYDIAWARLKTGRGILAGALENGSLDLWDADKLLEDQEYAYPWRMETSIADRHSDSFMSRTSKHSGAIKSLQFNPFRSELLATAGAKGEVWRSEARGLGN